MILRTISTTICFQSFDCDSEFGFIVPFFTLVKQYFDVFEGESGDQYAALRVFRLCAHVYSDAFPVGNLVDERHGFFESRRPCEAEWISAGRDEEVRVFEGGDFFFEGAVLHLEREGQRAEDGLAFSPLAGECYGDHVSFCICSQCR